MLPSQNLQMLKSNPPPGEPTSQGSRTNHRHSSYTPHHIAATIDRQSPRTHALPIPYSVPRCTPPTTQHSHRKPSKATDAGTQPPYTQIPTSTHPIYAVPTPDLNEIPRSYNKGGCNSNSRPHAPSSPRGKKKGKNERKRTALTTHKPQNGFGETAVYRRCRWRRGSRNRPGTCRSRPSPSR